MKNTDDKIPRKIQTGKDDSRVEKLSGRSDEISQKRDFYGKKQDKPAAPEKTDSPDSSSKSHSENSSEKSAYNNITGAINSTDVAGTGAERENIELSEGSGNITKENSVGTPKNDNISDELAARKSEFYAEQSDISLPIRPMGRASQKSDIQNEAAPRKSVEASSAIPLQSTVKTHDKVGTAAPHRGISAKVQRTALPLKINKKINGKKMRALKPTAKKYSFAGGGKFLKFLKPRGNSSVLGETLLKQRADFSKTDDTGAVNIAAAPVKIYGRVERTISSQNFGRISDKPAGTAPMKTAPPIQIKRKLSADKMKKLKLSAKKYTISNGSGTRKTANISGIKTAAGIAGKVGKVVTAPAAAAGKKLLSQRADLKKSDDTGSETLKLGLQSVDYVRRGVGGTFKIIRAPKKIYDRVQRTVKTSRKVAKYSAKAAKATARTAKAAAKTAVKAAKFIAKVAVKVVKAAVEAVKAIVNLIIETAPWSLIIIAVIVVVILIIVLISSIISGIQGSVTGAGGWAIDDSNPNTPEQIYENLEEYLDDAKKALDDKVQQPLKDEITAFCDDDEEKPRRILDYQSEDQKVTFFPAKGKDSIVGEYIDDFDIGLYPDFLAALFVLKTREKQQADDVTDMEIYDFDFERADFEEFLGDVDSNTCRWGKTFVYKTTVEITDCTCPGENCETKYLDHWCDYYYDDRGRKHYYCSGHPYCPGTHTKLQVQLYTVMEYTDLSIPEIYDFTENESIRFEAAKEFIAALIRDYGGETSD